MLKLERLVLAMAEHEGWNDQTRAPASAGSRSYRNHNPGNMRSSPLAIGKASGFAVFNSDEDGFAAMRLDIMQKATGHTSTGLNGNSSLADLIQVWAPTADGNDPNSYLNHVLQMTGFVASMKLSDLLR
jgi:hypothetical protein